MKRVLAINGGGIFGLIPALLLAEKEARTGKSCAETFDLIAGTSTGGIIGSGLAVGVKASQLAALYRDHGAAIFHNGLGHEIADLDGISGPKYSADTLDSLLKATLGDKSLADASTRLLVPASQCAPEVAPYWFKSWQGPNFPLWQVARATSAAPYYFPPAEITAFDGTAMVCADGGLWANDPEDYAALTAAALWPGEEIFVLSLGTGTSPLTVNAKPDWGALDWAPNLIEMMMTLSEAAAAERAEIMGIDRIRLDAPIAGDMDDVSPANMTAMANAAASIIAGPLFTQALDKLAA